MKLEKAMMEDGRWSLRTAIRLCCATTRQVRLRMASARQGRLALLKMAKMCLCKILRIKGRRASLGFVGPLNF